MITSSETLDLPRLPPGWCWSTMSQACLKIQDGTHFSPKNQHAQGKYRYITAKNVKPSGLDLGDVSFLSEADHRVIYKRCDPQKGDILLVKDGVNTGDAALNTLNEEFSLLSSVCLLRPRPELISSHFLRYFLLSPTGYRLLTGQMTGTAIKRIVLRRIKDSPVPIAPMSEQQLIVAEIEKQFSRLDEAVALFKRTKANLKRYKAAILKAAVEGKLTEEWRKAHPDIEPASKLLERILAERRAKWKEKGKYKEPIAPDTNDLPSLPKGWTWATVEQLSTLVQYGSSEKTREDAVGVPVLRMGNIEDGRLQLDSLKYLPKNHDEFPELFLRDGDILFNRTNSAELVGKTAVYKGKPTPCSFASYLIRVRLAQGCVPDLLAYFINSVFGRTWIAQVVSQQVGQANVNGTKLQALGIPLPPVDEQGQIVSEVERRLSIIDELEATVEANLTRADRLRQSVLGKAFSGKLLLNGAQI